MAANHNKFLSAQMLYNHVKVVKDGMPVKTKRMKVSPVKYMKWQKVCDKHVTHRIERHAFFVKYTYQDWHNRKYVDGDVTADTDHIICKGLIMALDFLI